MKTPVRKFKETVEFRTQALRRLRSHRYFPFALLVFAVLAVSSIHIWQRVKVMSLVEEVAQLRLENSSLVDDAIKYESEIVRLQSAGRIIAYSRDTLKMKPVEADRLFTLVRDEQSPPSPDDLAVMRRALERVADYMPGLTESHANAGELRQLVLDSLVCKGDRR